MLSEGELRSEDDIWSLNNIKNFLVPSFYKRKKKKKTEKEIVIALKKYLL